MMGKSGLKIFKPSTADDTLMAGVINPSAINVAQPIMAG